MFPNYFESRRPQHNLVEAALAQDGRLPFAGAIFSLINLFSPETSEDVAAHVEQMLPVFGLPTSYVNELTLDRYCRTLKAVEATVKHDGRLNDQDFRATIRPSKTETTMLQFRSGRVQQYLRETTNGRIHIAETIIVHNLIRHTPVDLSWSMSKWVKGRKELVTSTRYQELLIMGSGEKAANRHYQIIYTGVNKIEKEVYEAGMVNGSWMSLAIPIVALVDNPDFARIFRDPTQSTKSVIQAIPPGVRLLNETELSSARSIAD